MSEMTFIIVILKKNMNTDEVLFFFFLHLSVAKLLEFFSVSR